MTIPTPDQIATALIAAHQTGTRISPPEHALSRPEILDIQSQVAAALGPVCGFKVGRASDGPPILAPLPMRYRVVNGDKRQVKDVLGIELEIGFRVIRAFAKGALPEPLQDYLHPCAVFELVDSRFTGSELSANLKFCDFQMNAGVVVGTGLDDWDGRDFSTVQATFVAGDTAVLDDMVSVPGGSAIENLALLAKHLGTHCGGIQAGQILITGSLNGLPYFAGGQTMTGTIAGIGRVSVTLDALVS